METCKRQSEIVPVTQLKGPKGNGDARYERYSRVPRLSDTSYSAKGNKARLSDTRYSAKETKGK